MLEKNAKAMITNRSTVLVIKDSNLQYNYESVKSWFDSSDFSSYEAADLFDAIGAISDFTNAIGPDIVLVRMKSGPQFDGIAEVLDANSELFEIPIAILSDIKNADEKRSYNFGSLNRLKVKLDSRPVPHA